MSAYTSDKPLRVMFVSHRFPPDGVAGVERVTQWEAAALAAMGHSVSVFTRRAGEPLATPALLRERLPDGTTLYRLDGGGEAQLNRFLKHQRKLDQYFTTALAETSPDVVHFSHLLGLSPRFPMIARRFGAAVVMSLHDFYMACPLLLLRKTNGDPCQGPDGGRECARACFAGEGEKSTRWGVRTAYFRRLLELADQLITPSKFMADWFTQYGVDADRLRVVPNGVSIPKRSDPPTDNASPSTLGVLRIAFLGSVVRHKGLHVILDALRMPIGVRVELTAFGAIGDAAYARDLRTATAGIPDLKLRLFGPYQPRQLPLLLEGFDCAVTPSVWAEVFAIVVREALVRGVPALVSRRGGMPEVIREGENGFSFDPDRPQELAAQLRRIAHEPGLLPRLRRGALETDVLTNHQHAQRMLGVYQDAINKQAATPALMAHAAEAEALNHSLVQLGLGD